MTKSGDTAMAVAKYRPQCPILAVVSSEVVANKVLLSRGVIPLLLSDDSMLDTDTAMSQALDALQDMGLTSEGEDTGTTGTTGTGTHKLVAITGSGGGFCSDEIRQLILM